MSEAICSTCVQFRAVYRQNGGKFNTFQCSIYQEHLRLDHNIKRWEDSISA